MAVYNNKERIPMPADIKHSFMLPVTFVRREALPHTGQLTLICTGAGWGKSTCLAQLAQETTGSVCVELGYEDNSADRLTALLSEALPDAGIAGDIPSDCVRKAVQYLSNKENQMLLIDNADLITDRAAGSLIAMLARLAYEGYFTMVLAARQAPAYLLPFILEGKVSLWGIRELQLTLNEVRTLAGIIRSGMTDDKIKELYTFTGGWVMAFSCLLRSSEQDPAKAADASFLSEYTQENIIGSLPDDLREFMLVSAFLQGDDSFYREGLGLTDAGALRQKLLRMGIAYEENGMMTYPEVLRHILIGFLPMNRRKELMEQAADHFVSKKQFAEAIRLFDVSGNAQAAERILSNYGEGLLSNCEFELIGYCGRIIGSLRRVTSPDALGALAQYYYYIGDYEKMEQAFNIADSMFGKENRFSVLRKFYNGLLRYEKKPELYASNVLGAISWLDSHGLSLPFLYSSEQEQFEKIRSGADMKNKNGRLYVNCFGTLRLSAGEEHTGIQCRTKRSSELIAYMLEHEGRPVGRDELLNVFWPEEMPANAVAMLHNMIYHLRRELTPFGLENIISYKNKFYALDMSLILREDSEILEVCKLLQSGSENDIDAHEGALKEYWGAYLGTTDSQWANERREYYDRCFINACTIFSAHCCEKGNYESAVSVLKNAFRLDPYSEQLVYELISCYAAMGKPDKARLCYEEYAARLDSEFGTSPSKWLRSRFFSCFSSDRHEKLISKKAELSDNQVNA